MLLQDYESRLASTLLIKVTKIEKMSLHEIKEEKKPTALCQDIKQRIPQFKAFKNKLKGLEDAVFESRAVKHAVQFTKTLKILLTTSKTNTTMTLHEWSGKLSDQCLLIQCDRKDEL